MLRTSYETPLYLLIGIAGLVLVIACANLANHGLRYQTYLKMLVHEAFAAEERKINR